MVEVCFYLWVESVFEKIICYGDYFFNYWWEVIDKDGMCYFYGGMLEMGLLVEVIFIIVSGVIVYWVFMCIIDISGN